MGVEDAVGSEVLFFVDVHAAEADLDDRGDLAEQAMAERG